MTEITTDLVKQLRDRTGVGLMDCKEALKEHDGDIDEAAEYLRVKGIAEADEKEGREVSEGLVRGKVSDDRQRAALVQLSCETDFVARNDEFQDLLDEIVEYTLENGEIDPDDLPEEIDKEIKKQVSVLGENLQLEDSAYFESQGDDTVFTVYHHMGGRIGVLLESRLSDPDAEGRDEVKGALKNLAMQIAAAMPRPPKAVTKDGLDQEEVEQEKQVLQKQAEETGKPDHIIEQIVEGRLDKFLSEVVLLNQPFIKDDDQEVSEYLDQFAEENGVEITPLRFSRQEIG